jgi:hypothetical protein
LVTRVTGLIELCCITKFDLFFREILIDVLLLSIIFKNCYCTEYIVYKNKYENVPVSQIDVLSKLPGVSHEVTQLLLNSFEQSTGYTITVQSYHPHEKECTR